jgi:beta-lactamase superfamily II metal-dependent hydrolase
MEIHFLNVGKGNCTVIQFPNNRLAIVDIDNSHIDDQNDILTDPIDFLNNKFPNKDIFRFILTHPDMDHMTGLNDFFNSRTIYNFWDTDNNKKIDTDNAEFGPYDKKDWEKYLEIRKSESEPKALQLLRNTPSNCCWAEDNIQILSPSKELVKLSREAAESSDKYNHISYVLRIEYKGIVTILGGDATKEAWDDIFEHYNSTNQLNLLKANVLLASHHGSPNNVNKEVFKHIDPDYVVISVLRGVDYDYSYYNTLATKQVYSTKSFGNIKVDIPEFGPFNITPEKNGN